MITFDAELGLYVDMRRDVTGYGATPEGAQKNADDAEQARAVLYPRQAPPLLKIRWTLLTGRMEIRCD